jgi:ribosomal protein L16/L10AE
MMFSQDIVVTAAGKKKIEVAREVMDRYLDLTGESVERAPTKPVWYNIYTHEK